ncbi:hypothetical protein NB636_04275 [Oxalobacter aliiformigenes]|uniref:hypothetical protein n=1 Tax=Oxalobacter aliiformigenes TaxID=2946593 RepID=UPI0022AE9698|nr:hypothetical protein [Oxalobacter aliiformigenes]MCZ4065598.1 hypothetical protein [Oxalobacter aliiformigenes]WAW00065.1 hypothetical protein NB636_04275 [Oxalobacter aliiformigenes]
MKLSGDAMKEHVTVIQWHNGKGEMEINDNGFMSNHAIDSYDTDVRPYVDIWQSVSDRMVAARQNSEPDGKTGWQKWS